MPIFEYHCPRCRHSFEQIVLSARERVRCPKCNSGSVKKQLSVFSSPGSRSEESPASAGGCGGCGPHGCGCH